MCWANEMKAFFHASDFDVKHITAYNFTEVSARIANNILNKHLESLPVVYASELQEWQWTENKDVLDTHKARLFGIEEIKKEPCKHEPQFPGYGELICKYCQVELIAEWRAK